jgi:hypothetical protein
MNVVKLCADLPAREEVKDGGWKKLWCEVWKSLREAAGERDHDHCLHGPNVQAFLPSAVMISSFPKLRLAIPARVGAADNPAQGPNPVAPPTNDQR